MFAQLFPSPHADIYQCINRFCSVNQKYAKSMSGVVE